ncbi:hypothetical protein E2C01_100043 [Portunus trituberculatus]|uniref:Uncharacterized protein n=1 Tax=Portunus trituberculatus TaxID=210409 RepID=A0A5B7K1Y5_PORTR|nr:hypothetical protein [Portunus trituberculatus]
MHSNFFASPRLLPPFTFRSITLHSIYCLSLLLMYPYQSTPIHPLLYLPSTPLQC